ncbi:NF-kappa-B inhibitor-like protein 1 isoform X1 [Alosa alosa]|nr:NF-kappa-B inhibitor-like protein 1 isoform X1 [Alosa alosa]
MVSRRQKRLWRYVEEGSLLKLKSYLRKHSDLTPNFSQGKRMRTPLHLVCCHGDDAILRVLMKHGADPLQKDKNGNTALHAAVKRALKHGKRAYDDLVVPLREKCPDALDVPNKTGVTPRDMLEWVKFGTRAPKEGPSQPERNAEREWREKLMGECHDEFSEMFGKYDDDFRGNEKVEEDVEEDFMDWADRIRLEYMAQQRARAQRAAAGMAGRRRREGPTEEEQRSHREQLERLQREHLEYLERAARKQEETRLGKKKRYDERCERTFGSASASQKHLSYTDIPWPAPHGSVPEMLEVMLHGADRADVPAFRKLLKRQQTIWHPDRFAQRCGERLEESDKQRILDTVTALSQELNRLAQSLR